jgi:methylglutaconyl-CoA hydratase
MTFTTLELTVAHRVAVLWLARPKLRNAFNETTIAELTAAFERLGADGDIAAIVLAAQGPAFCAGADLDWMRRMSGYSREENLADARKLATMLRTIYMCPKPVIARVHGDAVAGGMGLVAACDIAVASHDASFCLSEVKLGLIPATIAPYVIRAMGESSARRYFITAEKFTAAEAYRIGFVHELAAPDEIDARINEILGSLMQASASAVADAKRLVCEISGRVIDAALMEDTAARIADARASTDGKDGVASFLAKRKPRWVQEYDAMVQAAQDEGKDESQ